MSYEFFITHNSQSGQSFMKELIDTKSEGEPESAPLQQRDAGAPMVGMERATELDTAGAPAVVQRPPSRNLGDLIFGGALRIAVWIFLAVLAGIIVVVVAQSWPNIQHSGLGFFFQ